MPGTDCSVCVIESDSDLPVAVGVVNTGCDLVSFYPVTTFWRERAWKGGWTPLSVLLYSEPEEGRAKGGGHSVGLVPVFCV